LITYLLERLDDALTDAFADAAKRRGGPEACGVRAGVA